MQRDLRRLRGELEEEVTLLRRQYREICSQARRRPPIHMYLFLFIYCEFLIYLCTASF